MDTQLTCIHCGNGFLVNKKKDLSRKFCGSTCYRGYEKIHGPMQRRPEPIDFKCRVCETPFSWMPGRLKSYTQKFGRGPLYCSLKCNSVGRRMNGDDKHISNCVQCGKEIQARRRDDGILYRSTKLCSSECRSAFKLAEHDRLTPTEEREIHRGVTKQGYIRLRFPNKYGVKGREVLEHRYNMEQHLGRELRPEETVHHKVKPVSNNAMSNLELFSSRHGPGQRVTEQIDWAIKLLQDYPDVARDAGYELTRTAVEEPLDGLFGAIATGAS